MSNECVRMNPLLNLAKRRESYTFGGRAISAANAQYGIVTYWTDQLNSAAVGTTLYAI